MALDEALASTIGSPKAARPPRPRLRHLTATMLLLLFLLVAVPELLGDQPYDPRPSTWPRAAEDL